MLSDIEITHQAKLEHISKIGEKLGLKEDDIELYGKYKAKITPHLKESNSKLILVTATNPTPFGEGKTTTSIGLADALNLLGKKVCLALREPSLGPVFGIKGGAAGGGYSQLAPMEDLNLHFTGDFHAITSANNLISAMIDNSLHQENPLKIDKILWKRCMDMNDRALRFITVGQGGKADGVEREDGFNITAASEIMAILCLATSLADLKEKISNIMVAYDIDGKPIYVRDLGCADAVCILLKDAIKPNLFQTIEHTPTLVHGGPFANIAHGCNSIIATKTALNLAEYVVTEAGFGSELGAEKFIDIKCAKAGLKPDAVVLVTTIRSLKYNGNADKSEISVPNMRALKEGIANLGGHIENLKDKFGLNLVVALNKFGFDVDDEINFVREYCAKMGVKMAVCENFAKGGEGGVELANFVLKELKKPSHVNFIYKASDDIKTKITKVATQIYGADDVIFEDMALSKLDKISSLGLDNLPVCIAKTQYSFSDDAKLLGRAKGFKFSVKDLEIRTGAGFIVAVCGKIMLMPGLSKKPSAMDMRIDENGVISGLA
ncbi:formate--tetrahydrofolate ligase [Campylobacter sp. RM9344]|uniref:Formate--tetrahydrofolate ligase n=1 Tax=Campylobacter californiensis TaxID=1032243 RepID=A0AAW3ZSG4_9BACT|nr:MULTISPECIES: formate--tetrahydrofolate ligase [unclassified Campylobacter]MBE2984382.1 formate--tetrahydrofolate ligase [Campylobacter sp. RM6883]MBE2995817.1 formate--tetrahydrofolate ligase [Campylobacter sp. RM6913]MBE3029648.1 formate--tetrahydrofolate ligase [Campylobacter sp. RM9344]MBE3607133.1 formate--tetrahydrofolate ligase [Campylobacter sp. RM9337]QCD50268.1 formate--tetrahydrofolate ligase [Campylobacter sp. RM6914]